MKAIDSPLEDNDIEKLFEKYNLIPDLIDEITISREDIIEFQDFEDDPDKINLIALNQIPILDTFIPSKPSEENSFHILSGIISCN